jgi:hypothetical protein
LSGFSSNRSVGWTGVIDALQPRYPYGPQRYLDFLLKVTFLGCVLHGLIEMFVLRAASSLPPDSQLPEIKAERVAEAFWISS